ncbi:uncharacterized protein [Arachis hypogaea]|uniref:uncharacterized protein n=1 Tax=Arachis hypogaea TaxID=3818 RepID=UPI003B219790
MRNQMKKERILKKEINQQDKSKEARITAKDMHYYARTANSVKGQSSGVRKNQMLRSQNGKSIEVLKKNSAGKRYMEKKESTQQEGDLKETQNHKNNDENGDQNGKHHEYWEQFSRLLKVLKQNQLSKGLVSMAGALARRQEINYMDISRNVTDEEIKDAVFSLGSWKAPGSDGLPAKFYQHSWNTVANSIIDWVKKIFREPDNIAEANRTLIAIIPKILSPENFGHFRPISLCDVCYKFVTKILASRLKKYMPTLFSNTQASFVPGRISADNILVAQEVVHTMRYRSHDDIVLFAKADKGQVKVIKEALRLFCDSSGQRISFNKSCVYFSKNVNHNVINQLSQDLGISSTANLGKYLGVPLIHERCSQHHFQHIIDKMQLKLSNWKKKYLSLAGRCTLVQSVLSTIPSYCMQTMKIPTVVSNKIDKVCRDFLWGNSEGERKIHLMNWDKICQTKEKGSLGIRKAQETNQLFLMKLAWGLTHKRQSLWVQIMRAKYGRGEDIIPKVRMKANNSNAWNGIVKVWENFSRNIIWRIGNGHRVLFWKDLWVPGIGKLEDLAISHLDEERLNENVATYVTEQGTWDWDTIRQYLPEKIIDHLHILKAPNAYTGEVMSG